MSSFESMLAKALNARSALLDHPDFNALRLLNGAADGFDGLVIEQFADVLVAQIHEGRTRIAMEQAKAICGRLAELRSARCTYLKKFPKDRTSATGDLDVRHRDPRPWIGSAAPAEVQVRENGQTFLVRPFDGFSVGLFLDHRDNRRRVREIASGRMVLNTFSYTCAFSVAAALGGAAGVVSVDVSKKSLEWGKRNLEANNLSLEGQTFIRSDIFDYFGRAARQQRSFDLVILDPPSFARAGKTGRAFSIQSDLDELLRGAIARLAPGGVLVFSTNHRAMTLRIIEAALRNAAAPRAVTIIARPALPIDFRGDPDYARSIIAEVA